jgi:hypothetical protein
MNTSDDWPATCIARQPRHQAPDGRPHSAHQVARIADRSDPEGVISCHTIPCRSAAGQA